VSDDDERLLIETAQRDPSRFADVYERHFENVWAYVIRRVRDRAEAEDITAEVFRSALQALPRFEWRGVPVVAWLYRIAANEIAGRAKRSAREVPVEADLGSDEMQSIERRASLFRLVHALPPAQREVIVKRFAEERSIAETAKQMGKSEGAIKQLQLRALENLRAAYGGRDV
jgi:RNA polymerase sigma-70 factor (ECF subfamily)